MISFTTQNTALPRLDYEAVRAWIAAVAESYGRSVGDVAYVFCDDEEMLRVNRAFLNHDYYTDIITFSRDEGRFLSGDIIISLDTVRSNAEGLGVSYDAELHRVVIHGILHLCGINDKSPEERAQMEAAENKALALLAK